VNPKTKWSIRGDVGFTLIELAVSLFIVALLLGAILVPLATQVESRQIGETQKTLEETKDALMGFAVSNGYLPCPDTTGDGIADPATPGACPNAEGFLPWVTLNVGQSDAWGNRLRYRVSPEFTNTPSSPCTAGDGRIGLCKTGNITINTRDAVKNSIILSGNVAAVILSHGRNGYGAISTDGFARLAPPGVNVDEALNANPPGTAFLSRTATMPSSNCSDGPSSSAPPHCEFDDLVVWLSSNILFNRMVAAGKLP
jgi:type II secretory pathway pseudopilin PulG